MDILRIEHLSKIYGKGDTEVRALDDVSFTVPKGQFVAIIGPSGSGKSTLLHILGGVDTPTDGHVYVDGTDITTLDETALAIFRRADYARADIPMLPVTHGVPHTRKQILFYSVILVVVTLLPVAIDMSGVFYLGGATVLNLVFLWYAWKIQNPPDEMFNMRMFGYSVVYLMALFAFLLVDHWLMPWV